MADSYTAAGKVRKIEQGAYPNAWAAPINNDAIELLDDMIAGTSAISLGVSTTYALAALANGTDSETRAMILKFTGTPASAVTVTVPASVTSKLYLVANSCGQNLTIKYAATAGVTIADGASSMVRADGTTVFLAATVTNESVSATLNSMKRTPVEITAGVTPYDASWPEGHYKRYGLTGLGVADETTARDVMLAAGNAGAALNFGSLTTFLMSPFTLKAANNNVPPALWGNNVTFKAKTGSSGVLLTIENPQAVHEGFRMDGMFHIDSNNLCSSAMLLHGCQRAYFGPMRFINSTSHQVRVEAEAGFGVYYNMFQHWIAGGSTATGGGGDGFRIVAVDDTNRIASNSWISPKSNWNVGHGYYLSRCSDIFSGAEAERNDGNGVHVNFATTLTFLGGYTEHNHENMSGGGASDATPDVSFALNSDSNRIMIFGGRHTGAVTGADLGTGNVILPGTAGGMTITQDGMGFGGSGPVVNGLNFSNAVDFLLRMTGSTKFSWTQSTDAMRSHVKHLMSGEVEIDGALNHDGSTVGFYGTTPTAKQTGVAVTAAGVHAALVSLGLIS